MINKKFVGFSSASFFKALDPVEPHPALIAFARLLISQTLKADADFVQNTLILLFLKTVFIEAAQIMLIFYFPSVMALQDQTSSCIQHFGSRNQASPMKLN